MMRSGRRERLPGSGWQGGLRRTGWAAFSALALAGAGVAAYLTYLHWSGADPAFCAVTSGCQTVNRSGYSTLGLVPVALLGSLLYMALVALGLGGMVARLWAAPLAAGAALFGLAFSSYLTYAEVAVLNAICVWCVASLAIISSLVVLSAAQVWCQFVAAQGAVPVAQAEQAVGQP